MKKISDEIICGFEVEIYVNDKNNCYLLINSEFKNIFSCGSSYKDALIEFKRELKGWYEYFILLPLENLDFEEKELLEQLSNNLDIIL